MDIYRLDLSWNMTDTNNHLPTTSCNALRNSSTHGVCFMGEAEILLYEPISKVMRISLPYVWGFTTVIYQQVQSAPQAEMFWGKWALRINNEDARFISIALQFSAHEVGKAYTHTHTHNCHILSPPDAINTRTRKQASPFPVLIAETSQNTLLLQRRTTENRAGEWCVFSISSPRLTQRHRCLNWSHKGDVQDMREIDYTHAHYCIHSLSSNIYQEKHKLSHTLLWTLSQTSLMCKSVCDVRNLQKH